MRGYAGHEAPPGAGDRITVGAGATTLMKAIDQMKLAQKLGAHFKSKFLRVSPERFGVNFVTYSDQGSYRSLVEVGELPYDEIGKLQAADLPVVYPADPFLVVPTILLIKHPIVLAVKFKDAVAWAVVTAPEAGKSGGFNYRVGSVKLSDEAEQLATVIEVPASSFKIVEI